MLRTFGYKGYIANLSHGRDVGVVIICKKIEYLQNNNNEGVFVDESL